MNAFIVKDVYVTTTLIVYGIWYGLSLAFMGKLLSNYEGTLSRREWLVILTGISMMTMLGLNHLVMGVSSIRGVSERLDFDGRILSIFSIVM